MKRPAKRATKRAAKKATKRSTKRITRRPIRRVAKRRAAPRAARKLFKKGDTVMHWTYGLGTIVRLEQRELLGQRTLYYAVQVGDMTVWVPNDDQLTVRLRKPSTKGQLAR